ncbi:hypothetical protein J3R83DRAFT_10591 [Lanmaoa asiatica]|nr:hypothetical protein J3R83DRAFT_10591 [Lanmaoa asiatica]
MPKVDDKKAHCPNRNEAFSRQGLTTHVYTCAKELQEQQEDRRLAKEMRKAQKLAQCGLINNDLANQSNNVAGPLQSQQTSIHGHDYNFKDDTLDVDLACEEPTQDNEKDDIKVEYHPRSGCAHEPFTPRHQQPWEPFHSCLNFEIAKLMLHAALNKDETNQLISLIHRAVSRKESFSLTSHKEINEIWSGASHHFMPVKETQKDKHKPGFVNFKNAVWHSAFLVFLESLIIYSKTGFWFKGLDDILQLLFPIILILSSDYEEQCVMALIRGLRSKFPCPVCLVPKDRLANLDFYLFRNSTQSRSVIETARAEDTVAAKETRLKEYSLHDVDNIFWKMPGSDPHSVLSWDCLHAHGGLWWDHLWKQFGLIISDMGHNVLATIDNNFNTFPQWRTLEHFSQVMDISFTDGSKHKDISKLLLFATHPLIDEQRHPIAYQLLKSIQAFIDLDGYTALQVHTEETIATGRDTLRVFSEQMMKYIRMTSAADLDSSESESATSSNNMSASPDKNDSADLSDVDGGSSNAEPQPTGKNWNFPKMHTNSHAFDDIMLKGVMRNYNTKPNESMHRPLKNIY